MSWDYFDNVHPFVDKNLREVVFAAQKKPMNRVVAAKEGLSVLIGLNERIQAAVKQINAAKDLSKQSDFPVIICEQGKNNPPRKLIAGYRFYDCEECGHSGKQKTRDCHSPSHEICEKCNSEALITGNEEHPEWRLDKSGNLI